MFFCLHSIKSKLRWGGISPVLRLDEVGEDRESLYIELSKSSGLSFVEGKVVGLHHLFNNQPFDYGCFTESCFIGSGIWSSSGMKDIVNYLALNTEENNCLEDCTESYSPVCKVYLPYDYSFPHLTDTEGRKFIFVDIDCNNEPDLDSNSIIATFNPGNFDIGSYLEGSLSLYTYKLLNEDNGITLAITSGDLCNFIYYLKDESECFDSCSLSRLGLVGVYDDEGNIIPSFTPDPLIPDIDTLLISETLNKHLENINFKSTYLTNHKCLQYCNYNRVVIDGVEIRYNNSDEVWVEGLFDGEYVYTVDIGFIHPFSKEIMIWDKNVPLSSGGMFQSRKPIPNYRKVVVLKRTNRNTSEPILHYIESENKVIRTSKGYLLGYNYKDQEIDLEEISLTIINLLLSKYSYKKDCDFTRLEENRLDPELIDICRSSLLFLNSLVNKERRDLDGSIPNKVATYSSYNSLYRRSTMPEIKAFEDGVVSSDCYLIQQDLTITDLYISNRSLCWLVYALCTYIEVTSDRSFLQFLSDICSYLEGQCNKVGLLREAPGSDEYTFATSAIFVMSLMRAHDITSNTKYLDLVADSYLSIDKYLLLPTYLYSHSYEEIKESEESIVYGLMYSIHLNKAETQENILKLLTRRYRPSNSYQPPRYIRNRSGALVNSRSSLLIKTSSYIERPSISKASSLNPIHTEKDLSQTLLYLLDSSLKYLSIDINKERMSSILESQIRNRNISSSLLLSYCLDEQVIGHNLFKSNSLYDLEHLLFHRRFVIEKLLQLPKDYTWFDKSALTKEGVIGSLLYTFSLSLSNWYVGMRRFKDGLSLTKAKDSFLYRWASDLSMVRNVQEEQNAFSQRMGSYLSSTGINSTFIKEALKNQGVDIDISTRTLIGIEGFTYQHHTANRNSSFIQGSISNPSTVYIESLGSLSEEHIDYIENLLPAGTQAIYTERLQMEGCLNRREPQSLQVRDTLFSFTYEVLCCPSKDLCGPTHIRVDLSNTYSVPMYIYGERKEGDLYVYIDESYRRENLIGLIKAGSQSEIIKIEAFK